VAAKGQRYVILSAAAAVAAPIGGTGAAIADPKYAPPHPTAALSSARGPRGHRPSCPRSSVARRGSGGRRRGPRGSTARRNCSRRCCSHGVAAQWSGSGARKAGWQLAGPSRLGMARTTWGLCWDGCQAKRRALRRSSRTKLRRRAWLPSAARTTAPGWLLAPSGSIHDSQDEAHGT
jgi:hypothetical protein